jgi:hypothetical protein
MARGLFRAFPGLFFTMKIKLPFLFAALFASVCLSLHAATTLTLLTPVSITATGGGQDVDVSRIGGATRVTLAALNTAGTNPTLACKLQTSAATTRGLEYSTVGTTDNKLRSGGSTNTKMALKFTQSGAAQIKRIGLYLKYNGTITSGKITTLAIQSDTAGSPSNTAIGTSTNLQTDNISTTAGWVVFTFTNPVDVVDATVYHLVLSGDYTASASNYISWYSTTVGSGGTVETSTDGTTWAAATSTEKFMAYVDQYAFTDLTGGGYATLSTAGNTTVQTLEFYGPDLPRFMRLYSTIGGTSSPAFSTVAIVSGQPSQQ